jgi:integrase/recombinase XerD
MEFERAKTARTKRNVEPIRVTLLKDAKDIIALHGNIEKTKDDFIFPVLSKGLTPERERRLIQQLTQVINHHINAIALKVGIASKVTTYAARHSFATVLLRNGTKAEEISGYLGHASIRTTQNYLSGFEDESRAETVKALTSFKTDTATIIDLNSGAKSVGII